MNQFFNRVRVEMDSYDRMHTYWCHFDAVTDLLVLIHSGQPALKVVRVLGLMPYSEPSTKPRQQLSIKTPASFLFEVIRTSKRHIVLRVSLDGVAFGEPSCWMVQKIGCRSNNIEDIIRNVCHLSGCASSMKPWETGSSSCARWNVPFGVHCLISSDFELTVSSKQFCLNRHSFVRVNAFRCKFDQNSFANAGLISCEWASGHTQHRKI